MKATILLAALVIASSFCLRGQGAVWPVDTNAQGVIGNGMGSFPSLNSTGRYLGFQSAASNLVPGDTNGVPDLFIKDLETGAIERINVSSQGAQSSFGCFSALHISESGQFVLFACGSPDLVPSDTNNVNDVFLRDRTAGTTLRISTAANGLEGNGASRPAGLSSDGRFALYISSASNLVPGDTNGAADLFLYDTLTGVTTIESRGSYGGEANQECLGAAMSIDGRTLVFSSRASNLLPNDINGLVDVFLRDRVTGSLTLVSRTPQGLSGNGHSFSPSISLTGQSISFLSLSTNLAPAGSSPGPHVFVWDQNSGVLRSVDRDSRGIPAEGSSLFATISGEGRHCLFTSSANNLVPGDVPLTNDLFLRDLVANTTRRITVSSTGAPAQLPCLPVLPVTPCGGQTINAAIASDSSLVVFDHADPALLPPGATVTTHLFATYWDCALSVLRPPGTNRLGILTLRAPAQPLVPYLLALSFNSSPGIPVGTRLLPLAADELFALSLNASPFLLGSSGLLDSLGSATATIDLPSSPSLLGLSFFAAFVTLDPNSPGGIHRISNALPLSIST